MSAGLIKIIVRGPAWQIRKPWDIQRFIVRGDTLAQAAAFGTVKKPGGKGSGLGRRGLGAALGAGFVANIALHWSRASATKKRSRAATQHAGIPACYDQFPLGVF